MTDLVETLKRCEKWLDRYRSQGRNVGEQNTKAGLVEPILEGLGWDIRDPDEVHREYRRLSSDNPVDYALLLRRTPRLFVEAKGIGENLDDPKWANQIIAYATAAGVEWVALTNGAEWRIYNAHAPVPIEQKMFRTVRIDDDRDDAVRTLQLLGKDNTGENKIEELWKTYFVDRRVREVLVELFSGGEPARELVNAVRHRSPSLTLREVRESLARARATFEFPVVEDVPGATLPRAAIVDEPRTARSPAVGSRDTQRQTRLSDAERSLTLVQLIATGRLKVGTTIETTYMGERHEAEVSADGGVRYQDKTYRSLSTAGEAVKFAVRGTGLPDSSRATDGWKFWHTVDPTTGRLVTLREIRRKAALEIK